ncbi:50S ribosomal protein L17 [Planctomycetales bacterium]|nr:50S ribosomal protein L17 [Planctomycetales bacterium]
MRHLRKGRKLGRNPNHQRALLKNLIIAILMTEREDADLDDNTPKVPGRIITTLEKAKEVRPLLEKCVTIAKKAQKYIEDAKEFESKFDRDKLSGKKLRENENWQKWNKTIAPALAARRRALQIIGDKKAVKILFEIVAPRFVDRNGGYTRILKLFKPRLGDAGKRAILEFVGQNARVKQQRAVRPKVEAE